MHTIIICGTPWCKLEHVQQILNAAGISTTRPAPSDSSTNISTWHDRLFFNHPPLGGALSVSKAWELGASQIFLANWDQPAWGWADSRSTWLLDFWRDFDSNTRFVLLFTPPQTVLTRVLADVSSDRFDPMIVLDQWCAYETELLKFFHRNRSRCVLLNTDQALATPNGLIYEVNQQLKLSLNEPADNLAKPETSKPIDQWLAQQLLQSHPAALALEQEMQSSLSMLYEAEQASFPCADAVRATEAAIQLRRLYRQHAELLIANSQNDEQLFSLQNQTKQQQQALQEQAQENNSLLLQLHQVQEELENNLLHIQALQQLNAELAQERDANAIAFREALDVANAQTSALGNDAVQLQNQIQQHQIAELVQARDVELTEKINLKVHCDELKQENVSLQNQISNQQDTLHEVQQENNALLLQLHQVQEQLEQHLLQNQQDQQDKKIFKSRIDRLLARHPDYCEWNNIEVVDASKEHPRWKVHGLIVADHTLPPIEVGFAVVEGYRELLLLPPQHPVDAALFHWINSVCPLSNAPLQPLRLRPDAKPDSAEMQTLRRLAPTDLLRLQTLCSALAQGLPANQSNRESLVQHLQHLKTQFTQLPATWRFDTVQLKHEQVHPSYEHLCFTLQNAHFGERQWSEFEFRIGAANIKKGKFSVLPRLEFPLLAQGNKPFINWHNESENEYGPKFELRFDVKTNAIDVQAWQTLTPTDQLQMLSIIAALPRLMIQLEQQGTSISRPWNDWRQLVISMQKTLRSLGLPTSTFEVI